MKQIKLEETKPKGKIGPTQTFPGYETLSTKLLTKSFKEEKKKNEELEKLSRVSVFKNMKIQHAKFAYKTPAQMDTLTDENSYFLSRIGPDKNAKFKEKRIKQKTKQSKTRKTKEKKC